MIADIFYPIFTITILACFTWKKNVWGFTPMPSLRHRPGPPGGAYSSPPTPIAIVFDVAKNWCVHIFSVLSLDSTFMTDSIYLGLGTIQICRNLNEHYYYLISNTSVIWQIGANCSPFQLQNMLPFHVRLKSLKLIY